MPQKMIQVGDRQYDSERIYELPLSEIFEDEEFNSRGIIDPSTLIELAKSIKSRGLDQPISVQPWSIQSRPEIKFRIIMGYRRFFAHKINKAETIRAQVREHLSEEDAIIMNLTENLHRENLNPLQEAKAIGHLKDLGLTENQVATRVGKSRGWVQERFMLLDMPDAIQQDVAAGLVNLKAVRKAYSLHSTEERLEFIKKVKDAKLLNKKREVKPESVQVKNQRKVRSREEMFELQDLIRDNLGNNIGTVVCGYAAGVVSDLEMHRKIAEDCQRVGKFYSIPDGLIGQHAEVIDEIPEEVTLANAER